MRVTGGQIPIKLAIIPKFANAVVELATNQNLKLSVQAELLNFMLAVRDITTPTVIPNHFTDNGNASNHYR
jgi:hypothetical protein